VYENRARRIFGSKRDEVTGSGENFIIRSLMICNTHCYAGDKIEKNEMGETCSSDGGGDRRAQRFGGET
jgi:hypothetical protein